jgi:hypothetical protein
MYALAWTYETGLRDLDAARDTYEKLQARYPLTRFAKAAREKIESGALKPPEPPPEPKSPVAPVMGAPSDTVSATAPDTAAQVPNAPPAVDTTSAAVVDSAAGPAGARPGAGGPRPK